MYEPDRFPFVNSKLELNPNRISASSFSQEQESVSYEEL
jgi:hypothetical protein